MYVLINQRPHLCCIYDVFIIIYQPTPLYFNGCGVCFNNRGVGSNSHGVSLNYHVACNGMRKIELGDIENINKHLI